MATVTVSWVERYSVPDIELDTLLPLLQEHVPDLLVEKVVEWLSGLDGDDDDVRALFTAIKALHERPLDAIEDIEASD